MTVRRVAVAIGALMLALAGCGGNDAKEEPQAIPAETTAPTTTTIAPTTTTTLSGLGVSQNYREDDPIRVPSMPVESPCFAIAMPASYPQTMKQR